MTKILYWNIQSFAFNKIANPAAPGPAGLRLNQILSNLQHNTPDIFVVVEVSTGGGPIGSPVTGAGATGAMELLQQIRANNATIPGNWYLVPPLISGTGGFAEGIAVYYNGNTVNFTGPNVLRAFGAGLVVSVTHPIPVNAVAAAYPPPWVGNALPGGNNFAGKVRFHSVPPVGAPPGVTGNPLTFPNLNNRSPFLTTFTEVGGLQRNLTIIAFHSSPALAAVGTAFLLGMDELITPLIGNKVQVLVGDFNVRLVSQQAIWVYPPFQQVGFTQHSPLAPGQPPAYSATHILPWSGASPVGQYPEYGYMNPVDSLDNIFTRYGAPPNNPINNLVNLAGTAVQTVQQIGLPLPVADLVMAGGAPTLAVAIMAAQHAAPVSPVAAANVLVELVGNIPALANLLVPAVGIQNAVNAIVAVGGAIPALNLGAPVPLSQAAAVADAAAFERAGAEVACITNAVAQAINANPALAMSQLPAGSPAANAAIVAAGVARQAVNAAQAVINTFNNNRTAQNAAALARAAAGTGDNGYNAAAPVAQAIAVLGAQGAANNWSLPANPMIVNRVVGAPYGVNPPIIYPSTLNNPNLLIQPNLDIGYSSFRGWNNYRAIRSTSDHMALVIDI